MKELKTTTETIDVETAKRYLEKNIGNRPISQKTVNLYADIMRCGNWCLNGETIKFDVSGKLIDGQHRLLAIVKSGVTIQTLVVREISANSFATIDNGRSKTSGQLLAGKTVRNYNFVSKIIKDRYALQKQSHKYDNTSSNMSIGKETLTNQDVINIFDQDPSKYEQYGQKALAIRHRIGKTSIAYTFLAAVWMHLVEDLHYSQAFVDYFFDNATSDESCSNQLVNSVRKMLCYDTGKSIDKMEYKVNRLFKAWNKYACGECDGQRIAWSKEREGNITLLPNNR